MFEQALMGIKTAEGKQDFKSCLHFLNFKLSSPSGILPTFSALHAIRRFRLQFALKGIFAYLLQWLYRQSETRWQTAGRNLTTACKCSFIFADFLDFACGS
jgi:hypothetical protein